MSILNTVAISYGATAALPFGTIVVIVLVLVVVNIPLLAVGGVIGHRLRSKFQAPSATRRFPRDIPLSAWYSKTPGQMIVGGLLPFSAIVLELHNFYASMWGYKIYTLPSILFVTFIILVVLVAMLSVGLLYIQLTVEDHEWWWRYVLLLSTHSMHIQLSACILVCVSISASVFVNSYLPLSVQDLDVSGVVLTSECR